MEIDHTGNLIIHLRDKTYTDKIKQTILETKKQHASLYLPVYTACSLPVYTFENINKVSNEDIQFVINDQLFLETLIMEIRGATISYSTFKKKHESNEEKQLMKDIDGLESEKDLSLEKICILEEKRTQLQNLREKKINGMIIRSRIQWIQEGEKTSRYFCNLEKRNFVSKQMCFLENSNGDITFDTNEIIYETKAFYENLYSQHNTVDMSLDALVHNAVKLNEEEKVALEG